MYILREAEYYGHARLPNERGAALGGQHLGPVGSRIVAETLLGLLWADKKSFLHAAPGWTPLKKIKNSEGPFTLDRLLEFALT